MLNIARIYTPRERTHHHAGQLPSSTPCVDFCALQQCAFPLRNISLTRGLNPSIPQFGNRCQILYAGSQFDRHCIIQSATVDPFSSHSKYRADISVSDTFAIRLQYRNPLELCQMEFIRD